MRGGRIIVSVRTLSAVRACVQARLKRKDYSDIVALLVGVAAYLQAPRLHLSQPADRQTTQCFPLDNRSSFKSVGNGCKNIASSPQHIICFNASYSSTAGLFTRRVQYSAVVNAGQKLNRPFFLFVTSCTQQSTAGARETSYHCFAPAAEYYLYSWICGRCVACIILYRQE